MLFKVWLKHLRSILEVLPATSDTNWEQLESSRQSRGTVVLVSGFGANHRTLSVIRKRLLKDHYDVVVLAMNWSALSDAVRGLYHMAEQLSTLVLELHKQKAQQRGKIILVAHSAGGLVARYYIQMLGGDHYCDGLVTIGTPHQGTWLAGLGFLTHLILKFRILYQLLPFSRFLKILNDRSLPKDFPMVSIYSKHDFICAQKNAALPKSWKPAAQEIALRGLSHGELLLSKQCYEAIREQLEPTQQSSSQVAQ